MVYTVGRMSITHLVILFAVYLGVHILIAAKEKKLKQQIEEGKKILKQLKNTKYLSFLVIGFQVCLLSFF